MENVMKQSQSYMHYFINSCKLESVDNSLNPEQAFCDPETSAAIPKAVAAIKGTCNSMCPKEETYVRIKDRMVHVLEVVGNGKKLVKRYCRPAADTNLAVAENLRPFHVLKETVDYLLFEVTKRSDTSNLVIYNFVADRLRAVRQDMIIQDLKPELRITLLEPMIRFHIFYGYLLCETPINDYSPTLNRNTLLECLKTCLFFYDCVERKKTADTHDISCLIDNMVTCSLKENDLQSGRNRHLVEALYVLTNLYDESPMWRLQRLTGNIRCAPTIRLAYKVAVAALHGYYVTVCKSIPYLCPLMFCAVALFLPTLQRRALQVMSVAYSCRGRVVPLEAVRAALGADEDGACRALRHYGLAVEGGAVAFQKGSFRNDAPLLPPRKLPAEHLEGKLNIDYILTYTSHST